MVIKHSEEDWEIDQSKTMIQKTKSAGYKIGLFLVFMTMPISVWSYYAQFDWTIPRLLVLMFMWAGGAVLGIICS